MHLSLQLIWGHRRINKGLIKMLSYKVWTKWIRIYWHLKHLRFHKCRRRVVPWWAYKSRNYKTCNKLSKAARYRLDSLILPKEIKARLEWTLQPWVALAYQYPQRKREMDNILIILLNRDNSNKAFCLQFKIRNRSKATRQQPRRIKEEEPIHLTLIWCNNTQLSK